MRRTRSIGRLTIYIAESLALSLLASGQIQDSNVCIAFDARVSRSAAREDPLKPECNTFASRFEPGARLSGWIKYRPDLQGQLDILTYPAGLIYTEPKRVSNAIAESTRDAPRLIGVPSNSSITVTNNHSVLQDSVTFDNLILFEVGTRSLPFLSLPVFCGGQMRIRLEGDNNSLASNNLPTSVDALSLLKPASARILGIGGEIELSPVEIKACSPKVSSTKPELVDPSSNLLGEDGGILVDPDLLAYGGRSIQGISADRATRGILRLEVLEGDEVAFESYDLTEEELREETGADQFTGISIESLPKVPFAPDNERFRTIRNSSGQSHAYAVLRSRDFVRPGSPDSTKPYRRIRIEAQSTKGYASYPPLDIFVLRPPVGFIHGITASAASWDEFIPTLQSEMGVRLTTFTVEYARPVKLRSLSPPIPELECQFVSPPQLLRCSIQPPADSGDEPTTMSGNANYLGFEYNAQLALTSISDQLGSFEAGQNVVGRPVAAKMVDIVGHSMGGLVARTMAYLQTFAHPANDFQGDVNKLITIGTPHLGAPQALLLLDPRNACTRYFQSLVGSTAFLTAEVRRPEGWVPVTGGFGDLQGRGDGTLMSEALARLREPPPHGVAIPTAMIAGKMSAQQLQELDGSKGQLAARAVCGRDPISINLSSSRYVNYSLMGQESDGIVPLRSAFHGTEQPGDARTIVGATHGAGTANTGDWMNMGLGGPHLLQSASGTVSHVASLLNASIDSTRFTILLEEK